jgi:hypothetical protein
MNDSRDILAAALDDPRYGWSIGIFGAVGEFMRTHDEPAERSRRHGRDQVVTARGGIGVHLNEQVLPVAYDTLSSDGETWNQALAFCLPQAADGPRATVIDLGSDHEALQDVHRTAQLFDLGVGIGHVRFCVRTTDAALIAALRALAGQSLLGQAGAEAGRLIARTSPHRVVLSPLARIEVYAPIPGSGESSPDGPHTHLLPKLLGAARTHAANAPIPPRHQPVLMLHPRSPWRDAAGARTPFDEELNREFERLLERFGLPEDRQVRATTETAVSGGVDPAAYAWPSSRRGRAQARITLRRLAQRLEPGAVARWKQLYDRGPAEEPDEDPTAPS